jgi:hypothetical protein
MPASVVTESKDFEPDGPDKDTRVKAGTWEFYHFNNHQIYLHVQPQMIKSEAKVSFLERMSGGDNHQILADKIAVNCYSRKVDRDVNYFFQKFLQRTMDENNPLISNTKCSGNARLD